MPLAFFCTLFFRHRKKSVSAPWDGQSQFAPESARQAPPREFAYGKVVSCHASRGAFRSPPCTPFGSPPETIERPMGRPVPIRAGGNSLRQSCLLMKQCRGLSARPQSPSGRVGEKTHGHAFLQKTQMAFLGANNRRGPHSARTPIGIFFHQETHPASLWANPSLARTAAPFEIKKAGAALSAPLPLFLSLFHFRG